MIKGIKTKIMRLLNKDDLSNLHGSVIELNNFHELKKVFGWKDDPILDRPDIYDFDYIEDVNERRIRDAESLATVMRNAKPRVALEIGTASGMATVLMSVNTPESRIYTVPSSIRKCNTWRGGHLAGILGVYGKRIQAFEP